MTKPKLILTIGSQGSGKSTWAATQAENYFIVNQDRQGKEGHLREFNSLLKQKHDIIVDRIGFTKEQRMRYVEPAKAAGYVIEYRYFHVPYAVAFDRIMKRRNHPTIEAGDAETAYKALNMYFDKEEFEGIKNECDIWIPMQEHKSGLKVLDLTNYSNDFKRVIVLADPHSCYDEMVRTLELVSYVAGNDMLLILGDLNDRGEQCDKVFEFVLHTPNVYVTDSNHGHKLKRWLRGNKVHTDSIQGTIDQLTKSDMLEGEKKHELYCKMMDFPYIIKIHDNYFTHAGFNPNVHPENTTREFCLYARYFDDKMGTFTREASAGYWFHKKRKFPQYKLFFGHIVIEDIKNAIIVNDKEQTIYGLDGGTCFGEKNRIATIHGPKKEIAIVTEIDSNVPKKPKDDEWDHMNKFETYDKLVEQGYLRKQESGPLVLFNYSEKCTYERYWNKYTIECRGLILNKETGDTVARPLSKFFNEFELENKTLPQPPVGETFVVEEKLDGSLGILYLDPVDDKYKIATRGSFQSDQAKIGTTMLQEALAKVEAGSEKYNTMLGTLKRYTPCFEIIYPENRFNDGARLVVDYGNDKTLVLLCAINKVTGKDLDEDLLKEFADILGFPLRKTYNYTAEEIKELQQTWPVNFEGVVRRYVPSGFRIKDKGAAYCKMQKILNSISPISIWEKMAELPNGKFVLPSEYKALIPEEILPEVEAIEKELIHKASSATANAYGWYKKAAEYAEQIHPENIPKGLGIFKQQFLDEYSEYGPSLFLIHKKEFDKLTGFVVKLIRPKGNEL